MVDESNPHGRITTFADYTNLVKSWFKGCFSLLILVGRPGLSKSYTFRSITKDIDPTKKPRIINGNSSAFGVYKELYDYQDHDFVFDDAESLWSDQAGRTLMRSVAELEETKTIQWNKRIPHAKDEEPYPQRFTTTNRICLICNKLKFGKGDEKEAILDRGHLYVLDPPALEVHVSAGKWFADKEIYSFIGKRLHLLPDLSFRHYKKTLEVKQAGRDWKHVIDNVYYANGADRLLIELEQKNMPSKDRVEEWSQKTGMDRATYFRKRKVLCRHPK